ncbi:MAG TPA: hypothetical protein V6D17_13460 [Candidatus Obscuribacterales bacterium]
MKKLALSLLAVSLVMQICSGCAGSSDKFTVKTKDGQMTATVSGDQQLPPDFPIPKYNNAKVTVFTDTKQGNDRNRCAMLESGDAPESICQFYKSHLEQNGWTIKNETTSSQLGSFIEAEKGTDRLSISAMKGSGPAATVISLNLTSS